MLFESLEREHAEEQKASTAQASLIVAGQRFQKKLGNFVSQAQSREEFDARVSLVDDDIMTIVATACREQGYTGNPKQVRAGLNQYILKFYAADGESEDQNAGKKCPHCGSKNIAKMAEAQGNEVIKCDTCGKRSYGDPANNSVREEITSAELLPGADNAYQHERQDLMKDHKAEGHPSEFNHDHTEKPIDIGSKDNPQEYQDVEQHDIRKNLTIDQTPKDFIKREYERVDADATIGDTQRIHTDTFGDSYKQQDPVSQKAASKWHTAEEQPFEQGSAPPGESAVGGGSPIDEMQQQADQIQTPDLTQLMQGLSELTQLVQQNQQSIDAVRSEMDQMGLGSPAVADQPGSAAPPMGMG